MDTTKTKEMIAVMQAFLNGEKIEVLAKQGEREWYSADIPYWNWENYEYRVKPKPFDAYLNISKSNAAWIYETESQAIENAMRNFEYHRIAVHVREVMDDKE